MKEFTQNIDYIHEGLRKDFRSERGLESCVNLKTTPVGLAPYEEMEIPFTQQTLDAIGVSGLSWPFPQLIRGKGVTLFAGSTEVYLVNEADWSLLKLDTYQAKSTSSLGVLKPGNQWQFMDFGKSWFLHNGISTVFYTHQFELFTTTTANDKVLMSNDVAVQAGCDFKGRAFMGGFNPEKFWDSDWDAFWADWSKRQTTNPQIDLKTFVNSAMEEIQMPMLPNMVMWSSIGGGDLLWLLLDAADAFTGHIGSGTTNQHTEALRPLIFDLLRRNEWGFAPMPWQGQVLAIKPLGDAVVVYGENGVSALTHHGHLIGLKELMSIGIASVGAVAGEDATERNITSSNYHVFVDKEGFIWKLDASLSPERLGYREYMAPMLGTDIVISHDASENEFYIGNGMDSFILTETGLTETKQPVTSGARIGDIFAGLGIEKNAMARTWELITSPIEGSRGLKKMTQVDSKIETDPLDTVSGQVFNRFGIKKSYVGDEVIELNEDGVFYPELSGNAFKVKISGTEFRDVDFDSLRVHLQYDDKRHRRGVGPLNQEATP